MFGVVGGLEREGKGEGKGERESGEKCRERGVQSGRGEENCWEMARGNAEALNQLRLEGCSAHAPGTHACLLLVKLNLC